MATTIVLSSEVDLGIGREPSSVTGDGHSLTLGLPKS